MIVLPVQVWSFVCAYVVILLIFWNPDRRAVFSLLSVPVWTAMLFHLSTVFGPFRVPVIVTALILIIVSAVTGVSETSAAAAADGNKWLCQNVYFVCISINFHL